MTVSTEPHDVSPVLAVLLATELLAGSDPVPAGSRQVLGQSAGGAAARNSARAVLGDTR